MTWCTIRRTSTSIRATIRANYAATAWRCGGSKQAARPIPRLSGSWCLVTVVAATAPRSICSKEDLQGLANRLGLEIRVAHYPPYCSKHNPIEHWVFPHVTRACQGVIFHSVDVAQHFIERTKTTTGLGVTVRILDKVYETGRKYAADFKQNMKIIFDDYLPKWNYRAVPEFT